ncbi:MAG: UvrD-helicase domain-containing protein, partial [Phycisphaerales bacterium]|nr:UvrD-helicase domain-containing protein [Phycisphaerales bacterium]
SLRVLVHVTSRGSGIGSRGIAENRTRLHYFVNGDAIYSDKIAKFVVECETKSSRAVTARLGQIYTDVFIDEFQDLAGWDLEVIRMLLRSRVRVTLVGDPRQHIYRTNPSRKNRQYLGVGVLRLLSDWERDGLCSVEYMNETHRCNEHICTFASALWPGMNPITALRGDTTGHDGVFLVADEAVDRYIRRFNPQVLRYDKRANTYGCWALNFGQAKGLEFDRVLIVPTDPIRRYLRSGEHHHVKRSRDKLHVAVTRARHSVAFVFSGGSTIVRNQWT